MKVLGLHPGTSIPRHAMWRHFVDELPLNHPLGSIILATTGAPRTAPAPAKATPGGDEVVRMRPSPQPPSPQVLHSARVHLSWLSRALSTFPHVVRLLDLRGAVLASEGAWEPEALAKPAEADRQAFDIAVTWDNCAIVTPDDDADGTPTTIAAPLHDCEGNVIAAIDVTAQSRHLRPEHLLLLAQAAMAIEQHVDAGANPRVGISGIIGSMPAQPAAARDEARIARALDLASVLVYITDAKDRILHISERAQAEWGRGKESLIGRSLEDVFSEETAQALSANSRKARQAKTAMQFEETIERGGRLRCYLTVKVPFPTFQGTPDAVAAIAIDITPRQKAQRKTEDYAHGLNALVDVAPALFAASSVRQVLRDVADAARRLVGAERADASVMSNRDIGRLLHATSVSETARCPAAEGVHESAGESLIYSVSKPVRQMVEQAADAATWHVAGSGPRIEPTARGWLAVPIPAHQEGGAGLIQAWHAPGREFTETDEAVLVQLARLSQVAIRNAEAREEAETSERRKDEFLALLGHELRNPLAPIRNATTLLAQPDLGRENIEFARNIIDRQVDQMTRMVNDLLDMSRIVSGRLVFQKQPVLVDDIVNRAVETCGPLFEAKRQTLSISKPDHDLWIDVDCGRLGQVLANLLHNAWKFTPEGGEITLHVERREHEVVLTVADTGQGIPVNMLTKIFGLFVQGDRSGSGGPGLGLGLWLARNLVELQGGTIAARSTGPGSGSEFVVTMPLLETPPTSSLPETHFVASVRDRSSEGRSILIVDDNKDSADSIALLLTAEGCNVRVAYTGAAALDITRTWAPDIVFLDIALPDMTGYSVIRKMRERETTKHCAIVAVTGWGRQRDREKTRAAGFDEHLVKPVDPAAIMNVVNEYRRGHVQLSS